MTHGFGIIGTGMIANFHAKAIQDLPNARLVACYSRSFEKAEAFASANACKAYESLEEMLADPDLTIVTICTPSGAHMEPAVAAAEAGKHVIIEKPLEITLERCDAIIAACEKAGVKLAAVFQSRFHDGPQKLKKAIDEGRFGTLTLGDTYVKWWRDQAYYDSGAWRGTWDLDGGGALMNQAIHSVDLLTWLMGPVKQIVAMTDTLGHERIEVEDVAVAALRFENGALGTIEATTAAQPGYLKKVEICGTEGSVTVEEEDVTRWDFAKRTAEDVEIGQAMAKKKSGGGGASDPKAIGHHGHRELFRQVLVSIDEDTPLEIDGHEGRRAVEIILGIYRAARTGRTVSLPLKSGAGAATAATGADADAGTFSFGETDDGGDFDGFGGAAASTSEPASLADRARAARPKGGAWKAIRTMLSIVIGGVVGIGGAMLLLSWIKPNEFKQQVLNPLNRSTGWNVSLPWVPSDATLPEEEDDGIAPDTNPTFPPMGSDVMPPVPEVEPGTGTASNDPLDLDLPPADDPLGLGLDLDPEEMLNPNPLAPAPSGPITLAGVELISPSALDEHVGGLFEQVQPPADSPDPTAPPVLAPELYDALGTAGDLSARVDPDGENRQSAIDGAQALFSRVARGRGNLDTLGQLGFQRFRTAPADQPGIALAGQVMAVQLGKLVILEVQPFGATQRVRVAVTDRAGLTEGDAVAVAGRLLTNPSAELPAYRGQANKLIFAPIVVNIAPADAR
jgi:predicted dehydrogenase